MSNVPPPPPEYKNKLFSYALSNALEPKKVNGLWFSEKEVYLDGYTFEECRFDNCKLHVANAENVNLINCYISNDSYFVYGASALSAIKLFNCRTDWYYSNAPWYVPQRDAKGRITLSNNALSSLAGLVSKSNV
ncbi:hypothetical protein [Microbulbifer hainanensis]|uniref:hypothetical protein n=1 Tax=Microbulbifer hainanensis TaxID=2735675 RepID=UPI0018672B3D|nr:hypothetical protein [Microbulbifer hainanensis]